MSRTLGRPLRSDVGDLAFRVWNAPTTPTDEPTIVLIHGIGVSHRYLARLHERLRERASHRLRVLSVDLPGHGGLPKPDGDADIARIAAGLGVVLDRCATGPVLLVGHSMGCQWVAELAAQRDESQHPAPVPGVVLMGPVADERHRTFFAQARALTVDTFRESLRTNAIVFTDYLRCGVPWYLRQSRHMLTYPLEERVRELPMPVLVLRGGRDPIAGDAWCRRLAAGAPRGAITVVDGGPHVVQDAETNQVADAVLLFAAGIGFPV